MAPRGGRAPRAPSPKRISPASALSANTRAPGFGSAGPSLAGCVCTAISVGRGGNTVPPSMAEKIDPKSLWPASRWKLDGSTFTTATAAMFP